jgi:ribosome biogenesis GTPase
MEGLVLRSTGSWYAVMDENGTVYNCRLRGQYRLKGVRTTNPVAVGDKVTFTIDAEGRSPVINNIHDRSNFIIRKATNLSKASHIIAANLDQALLVATIDHPRTSTGFIDRFLTTAEAYHIPAAIVFNKTDLYNDAQFIKLHELINVYSQLGYPCIKVSAETGDNIESFIQLMKDKTSLLSGHSGVGKSALLNAVDPNLNLRTGKLSSFHNKGMHTTTFAEMHSIEIGGWIVDTPGIKEFGLYDLEKETLAQRFPEMRRLMSGCKFANCTHLHEPGCAVKQALHENRIAQFRYLNYVNMMNSDFANDN